MSWYKMAQSKIRLWLDDNRDPKDPKIQELFGSRGNEVWVKTMDEAVNYIERGNVSFISFDHDLDNEGDSPIEKTGYHLACWIEERAFNGTLDPIGWNVHSRNPVGSNDIVAAMNKADEFWGQEGVKSE